MGNTPALTWLFSFFLLRDNFGQFDGVSSSESELRVIRVQDLYSGASEKLLTCALVLLTRGEKESVTRNRSEAAAISALSQQILHYGCWDAIFLIRAQSIVAIPTNELRMSDHDEENSVGEEREDIQDEEVKSTLIL